MASSDNWVLDTTLPEFVAEEAEVAVAVAKKVVNLFSQGNEVAYVARYRGDVHGGMSCNQLRKAFETFVEAKELNKKAEKAITNVSAKVESEQEKKCVVDRLKQSRDSSDVQDVVQMYATARKTKADKARSLGFGESADLILKGSTVNLTKMVRPQDKDSNSLKKVEENVSICIADSINRLPETVDAVKKISRLEAKCRVLIRADLSAKAKKWKEGDQQYSLISHFSNYTNFKKDADRVENYQILALDRAEAQDVLVWKVEVINAEHLHPAHNMRVARGHVDVFQSALKDSIQRLFIPKIQRAVRKQLRSRAEDSAIACFSRNLSQLFSQEGLSGTPIVALDPGFSACKAAFLEPNGNVIETTEFGLKGRRFDASGQTTMCNWARQSGGGRLVVAVGNGKASLETQFALADMIKHKVFANTQVKFCVVSECGASKYSITDLAEKELPKMKTTHRSAVSIGRRLLDPMGEYVKIEPKHLGMGMYQHSVNERKLREALALVVRECVSLRGVDVNNASIQLLQQVCGLNARSAAGIIAMRETKGCISSREELKTAKGVGPKAFEQCAGFLIVRPGTSREDGPKAKRTKVDYNPLDSTIVHPSQYADAKRLLKRAGVPLEDLATQTVIDKLTTINPLTDEEKAILDLLLTAPKTVPPPPLVTEVRRVSSLSVGETILGRVENQVDFGVFIDIGAEKAALAHRNSLRHPYPEVGSQLMVTIDRVDTATNRVSVRPLY